MPCGAGRAPLRAARAGGDQRRCTARHLSRVSGDRCGWAVAPGDRVWSATLTRAVRQRLPSPARCSLTAQRGVRAAAAIRPGRRAASSPLEASARRLVRRARGVPSTASSSRRSLGQLRSAAVGVAQRLEVDRVAGRVDDRGLLEHQGQRLAADGPRDQRPASGRPATSCWANWSGRHAVARRAADDLRRRAPAR